MRTKATDLDLTDYARDVGVEYVQPIRTPSGKLNWRGRAIAISYVIVVALIASLVFYSAHYGL
jgi:hypothetical protein